MITRKRFLFLGSLGILSALTPSFLFSKTFSGSTEDIKSLLKKARKYRKQKKYNLAKNTYEEVLVLDPTEIRAYNGIRRILLDKKNKEYEVILLYQQALSNIPNNFRLKQRLYNEYFKVAVGNKKVLKKLNISGRMLSYVKSKYEELLSGHPEKKNIQNQLNKINKYISLNVDLGNPHHNKSLKTYRKEQKKNHKKRFDGFNSEQATQMLSQLESKSFSKDRKQHIREMQKLSIRALRKEKKHSEAFNLAYKSLNSNVSDPYFIKQFRDLARQQKQYDKLLNFETQNHQSKNNFWSAISLFDIHYIIASTQNQTPNAMMNNLIQFMEEKRETPDQAFELITRKIKTDILNNDINQAKVKILEQCKNMMGVSCTHLIDRMNVIIANYYKKLGDVESMNQILKIANTPKVFLENPNELIKAVAAMNINRSYEKSLHIQNLQKKINSL